MNTQEANKLVKFLASLFPNQVNTEQAKYAAGHLEKYDAQGAHDAIVAHRDTHEFIAWPQLWEGCRTNQPIPPTGARQNVEHFMHGSAAADREAVVLDHFRKCWAAVMSSSAEPIGMAAAQAYILSGCRYALTEIRATDADAKAREVVGLEPGESIKSAWGFKPVMAAVA